MTLEALPENCILILCASVVLLSFYVFFAFRVKTDYIRFYFSGYKQKDVASKENFNDTCEICRPGTYGNHPSRSICEPCRGGVVCLEGQIFILHSFKLRQLFAILAPVVCPKAG